jgi:ATP-dependent DNA helicase RecQ
MEKKSPDILRKTLKEFFGFDNFKGLQESVIQNIYAGNDTFVIMPTGAGKSLCYQLPALCLPGTAIVISPLIALMKNQVDAIRAYSGEEGIAAFLNSSLTKGEMKEVRTLVREGKTKLLYVAPESLGKEENIDFLKEVGVSFVAVDEAHCISEWGHDFRPEYRKIKQMVAELGRVPIIALTATATEKVQQDIQKNLQIQSAKVFKSSFNRGNLYYEIRPKVNAEKSIIRFIKENEGKSGIIYCLSRKKAEEIATLLQANGINALPYHAGFDSHTRAENQDKFLMEGVDVIVATIAFGMGIDKPDVRYVIHYDMPKSMEGFYQETGRAGRDGLEGRCIAYFDQKDIEKLRKFMKDKPVAEKEIGYLLLQEMVSFAESGVCRRKQILKYFGENFNEKECNQGCDSCKNPQPTFSVKSEMLYLLETILSLNGKFGSKHILDFLSGIRSDEIVAYRHDQWASFGQGKSHPRAYWNAVLKYALLYGYVEKEIENYGLLHLSVLGNEFVAQPKTLEIPEDYDFTKERAEDNSSSRAEAADPQLLAALRDVRKKIGKEKNLPPYVIFQDISLDEMATHYPISMEELTHLSGVGKGKAEKYGKPFIDFIQKYVEENDIIRPNDFGELIVKSVGNKSETKIFIINCIDKRIGLDDIARSKNLSYAQVLEEVESIVKSGTKININYFVDSILDPEYQEELIDFFRSSELDDLEPIIQEFGDVYTIEELQLMKIKFLNEMAN